MGNSIKYKTDSGSELSSEELSSEVLKTLKSYVDDENVKSAIITTPAAFEMNQINATKKAAELAGSEYGAKMGTNQTPLGIHKIVDKIGDGAEFGSIFKSRRNTGRIAPIVKDSAGLLSKLHDYVLTRVFIIDGLEDGINKGRDMNGKLVDSKARCIYIHGTNNELIDRKSVV